MFTTHGSAPRAPGSLLAVNANGHWIGSLSGGCVEDDFLERVAADGFSDPAVTVRYGEGDDPNPSVRLPCDGILDILVENPTPGYGVQTHLRELESALLSQRRLLHEVELGSGARSSRDDSSHGLRAGRDGGRVCLRIGAAQHLLLAGYSSVAHACAEFDKGLGFEVTLCDLCEETLRGVLLEGTKIHRGLLSLFIADDGCHTDTAVVTLIHDPKIDDLAVLKAVRIETSYIGAMGPWATPEKHFERLRHIGGPGDAELVRIHAPIGLNLGGRTPAEIALAVLADILRIHNDIPRERL